MHVPDVFSNAANTFSFFESITKYYRLHFSSRRSSRDDRFLYYARFAGLSIALADEYNGRSETFVTIDRRKNNFARQVGMMVPYKTFGVRDYTKAVTSAINMLQKSTRGPRLGLFQNHDIHVKISMMELTPSPTSESDFIVPSSYRIPFLFYLSFFYFSFSFCQRADVPKISRIKVPPRVLPLRRDIYLPFSPIRQ